MLTIFIKSYDVYFDTFEIVIHPHDMLGRLCSDDHKVKSLIAATMMPYVAPEQCAECEDLPYDLVGKTFTMSLPTTL